GNPDANLTIYKAAKDIVSRYDIDGLHWDYGRYPMRDSGYNERAIQRYNEEFGGAHAPSRVSTGATPVGDQPVVQQPAPDDPSFWEWRRRQVTDFLGWVNADLLEIKPRLTISVSVFADLRDSCDYRFADWAAWNREGIVDVVMPMNFTTNSDRVF